jgi:DNA-binding transcriptional LysR family regulator
VTLEQLRIFVAVAEREHVTAAARALNLTQSAVSNAVGALETRHDTRLFDRVGRGVALNAAGRAFLPEARAVLARTAAAETALTDLGALRRGRLALFASQTIAGYWLPERLVGFHAAHPGVELDVKVGNTREASAAVRDGEAELGFVEGRVEDGLLSQTIVSQDQMVVLAAAAHPWSAGRTIGVDDLAAGPWVMREAGSGTRSTIEAALAAAGVDLSRLTVAMTLPSNEAVLAAVRAGAGVAALSESVAADALEAGRLVRAAFPLPSRSFLILRHRERYRSRAADAFAAFCTGTVESRA